MSYKNVKPGEAKELIDGDGGYTYVDVRSQEEFENGHPSGAVNVPVMHQSSMGMVPNAEFLSVMEVTFTKDDLVIIGCQSGARSLRAAEGLLAAGFTNIVHMDGGFGGTRSELGEVIEPGWSELGLPVDHGSGEGGYDALRKAQ
jgi:rhodanese-related sulfurtransferase